MIRSIGSLMGVVICGAAQAATFSDATFAPGDWSAVIIPAGGQGVVQTADGGNSGTAPDPFRQVTTHISGSTSTYHMNSGFVIDPAATPILSIDFALDYKALAAYGQGMAFGLAIEQGGNYYFAADTITGSGSSSFLWNTYAVSGLVASDFSGGTPDFTTGGDSITFGIRTGNDGGNGIVIGYDNYDVTVHTDVPEPATVALLLLAAPALIAGRRRGN